MALKLTPERFREDNMLEARFPAKSVVVLGLK